MSHLIRCHSSATIDRITPIARYKVLTEVPYSPKPVPTDWDFEILTGIRVRFHNGNLEVGQTATYPGYSLYSDARFCGVAFINPAMLTSEGSRRRFAESRHAIMSFPEWKTRPELLETIVVNSQNTIIQYNKRIVCTQLGDFAIIRRTLYFRGRCFHDIPIDGYISAIWKIDAGLIFLLQITCRSGKYIVVVNDNNPAATTYKKVKRAIRIKIVDPEKY